MAKRPALGAVNLPAPTAVPAAAPAVAESTPAQSRLAPSRRGKKPVMIWLNETQHEELRLAMIREKTSFQRLGEDFFLEWGRQHAVRLPA